jgi:hypothetical protein
MDRKNASHRNCYIIRNNKQYTGGCGGSGNGGTLLIVLLQERNRTDHIEHHSI